MTSVPAALLIVADPAGDVRGDGSYRLPSALLSGIERSVDLRELRAENVGGKLRLSVGLGGMDNPWNAPRGFSAVLLDVFVKTDLGGHTELGDSGFRTPAGVGWQRHYQVSGFDTHAWAAGKNGGVQAVTEVPRVSVEGSTVVLDTDLAAGHYSYWVLSRIYSPLTPSGFLAPRVGGDDASLGVERAGLPSPVDVLSPGDQARAYAAQLLPPVGELRDRRPLALLFLAGAGLLTAVFATFRVWRKQ